MHLPLDPPPLPVTVTATPEGVPVVWTPFAGRPRARLVFRVGQADETLATSGVTHLAEHLALSTVEDPPYDANGSVGAWITGFDVAGEPEQIAEHLERVCHALHALPEERFATELRILGHEAVEQDHPFHALRVRRHGLRGPGLLGCRQVGLDRLDHAEVQEWASRVFTRENAVVWLASPEPRALHLPLPGGHRLERLPLALADRGPSWADGPCGEVALSAVGADTPSLRAGASWLQSRLHHRLRERDGAVYSVGADLVCLPGGAVEVLLGAHDPHGDGAAVLRSVLEVLEEVRSEEPTAEHVSRWVRASAYEDVDPSAVLARLDRTARGLLAPEVRAGDDATPLPSPRTVREALDDALSALLLQVPEGLSGPPAIPPRPLLSLAAIRTGSVHAPARHRDAGGRLVVGAAGVMVEEAAGVRSTVLWDDCVLAVSLPAGCRQVVGVDGTTVVLDPADWVGGHSAVALVDSTVPRRIVVTVEGEAPPVAPRRTSGVAGASTSMVVVLFAAFTLAALVVGAGVVDDPGPNPVFGWSFTTVLGAGAALLLVALVRRTRTEAAQRTTWETRGRSQLDVQVDQVLARSSRGLVRGLAVILWSLVVLTLLAGATRGVLFWPAGLLAVLAVRATVEERRRATRAQAR